MTSTTNKEKPLLIDVMSNTQIVMFVHTSKSKVDTYLSDVCIVYYYTTTSERFSFESKQKVREIEKKTATMNHGEYFKPRSLQ